MKACCARQELGQERIHIGRYLSCGPAMPSMQVWRPDACWHDVQILELMGGEHAGISEAAKGLHNIEITGPTNPSEKRDSD